MNGSCTTSKSTKLFERRLTSKLAKRKELLLIKRRLMFAVKNRCPEPLLKSKNVRWHPQRYIHNATSFTDSNVWPSITTISPRNVHAGIVDWSSLTRIGGISIRKHTVVKHPWLQHININLHPSLHIQKKIWICLSVLFRCSEKLVHAIYILELSVQPFIRLTYVTRHTGLDIKKSGCRSTVQRKDTDST